MSHRRIRKILSAYLDGELEEQERRLVEEHLAECEKCSRELEALKAVDQMTRASVPPKPTEDYWKTLPARVRTRIIVEGERSTAPGARRFLALRPARLGLVATVAAVALVVLVGRYYLTEHRSGLMEVGSLMEEKVAQETESDAFSALPPEKEKVREIRTEVTGRDKEDVTGAAAPAGERAEHERELEDAGFSPAPPLDSRELLRAERTVPEGEGVAQPDKVIRGGRPDVPASKKFVKGRRAEEPLSVSARFELALSQQNRGAYDDAIKNYNMVMTEDEKLAPAAQFQTNLIRTTVRDTGSDEASLRRRTDMWQSFVDNYPESELAAEGYRNLADNAYQLSRVTRREEDIEQAIAAAQSYLDFIKEGKTTEYRSRARQIDDLQRDLERVRR